MTYPNYDAQGELFDLRKRIKAAAEYMQSLLICECLDVDDYNHLMEILGGETDD